MTTKPNTSPAGKPAASATPSGKAAGKPGATGPTQAKVPPKKVASDVVYSINDDRQIVRTKGESAGVVLATLTEANGLEYVDAQTRKMHPQVVRFLADEKISFNADAVTVAGDTELESQDTDIDSEHTPEYNASIPQPPKKTIESGDKTPAYVDWLRKFKPKTYAQKYGIVGEGQVTRYLPSQDARGRPTLTPKTEDAILSRRKTHRTEKLEAGDPANEQ